VNFERHRHEDVIVLELAGEFDASNLPAFSERMDRMIEGGDRKFVFDLRLLEFVSSAALVHLITTAKRLASRGGEMVLARPGTFIRKTLTTLGLDQVFRTFESVEAGVKHFRPGEEVGDIESEGVSCGEGPVAALPILFRPAGDVESEGMPNSVGRIVTLREDGVTFRYEPGTDQGGVDPVERFLRAGQTLRLKFRLPFAVEAASHLEVSGHVVEVVAPRLEEDACWVVTVRYDDLPPGDRERLRPFPGDGGPWTGGVPARLRPRPSEGGGHARTDPA
jgi:anti-anti-sigma factor